MRLIFIIKIIFALTELQSNDCKKREFLQPAIRYRKLIKNYKNYIYTVSPLLLLNNDADKPTDIMLAPNPNLKITDQITFFCPGDLNRVAMTKNEQKIGNIPSIVEREKKYKVGHYPEQEEIKEAKCLSPFFAYVRKQAGTCAHKHGMWLHAGFLVITFKHVYSICFDKNTLLPLYSLRRLAGNECLFPETKRSVPMNWGLKNFLELPNPNNSYTKDYQYDLFRSTFLDNADGYMKYKDAEGRILIPAPLMSPGVFYYESLKTATAIHENLVPVFSTIYHGNFHNSEVLGRILATHVNKSNTEETLMSIMVGTVSTLILPDSKGVLKEIYLDQDLNDTNNLKKTRPVPKFLVNIFYDAASNSGIAVVIINNPFLKNNDEADFPCPDIRKDFCDIELFSTVPKLGLTAICQISELAKKVNYVPRYMRKAKIMEFDIYNLALDKWFQTGMKEMKLK